MALKKLTDVSCTLSLDTVKYHLVHDLYKEELVTFLCDVAKQKTNKSYRFVSLLVPALIDIYRDIIWMQITDKGGPEAIIQSALEQGFLPEDEKAAHPNREAWKLNGQDFVHLIDALEIIKHIQGSFKELERVLKNDV